MFVLSLTAVMTAYSGATIVTPTLPTLCFDDHRVPCDHSAEFGCVIWHDLFWCDRDRYLRALARHSA